MVSTEIKGLGRLVPYRSIIACLTVTGEIMRHMRVALRNYCITAVKALNEARTRIPRPRTENPC